MPKLRSLTLNETQISDRALSHIAEEFGCLEYLMLRDTRVSDACIPALLRMKRLKELDIRGTQISDEGVGRIKDQLANVIIHFQADHVVFVNIDSVSFKLPDWIMKMFDMRYRDLKNATESNAPSSEPQK